MTTARISQEELVEIANKVSNTRSLLDLLAGYLVSIGGLEKEEIDPLVFAVDMARREARAAEIALIELQPEVHSFSGRGQPTRYRRIKRSWKA